MGGKKFTGSQKVGLIHSTITITEARDFHKIQANSELNDDIQIKKNTPN